MATAKAAHAPVVDTSRRCGEMRAPFASASSKWKRRADAMIDDNAGAMITDTDKKRGRFGELVASAHGDCSPFPGSSAASPFGQGPYIFYDMSVNTRYSRHIRYFFIIGVQ